MRKYVIALLAGAFVYGFWTMLITGGGHVNFIWIWLFITVDMFGLYFPIMSVLSLNLQTQIVRIIFGALIAANLILSSIIIYGWVTEIDVERLSDFSRTIRANGIGAVYFFAALHFLPTIIFLIILIWSVVLHPSSVVEEPLSLDLS